jgi:hypothetical protein
MKIRSILLTSAVMLFCTASISATTAAHTWVSGSGSDTNPCTFASPCATFAGALAKTSAGGLIAAKDAGDFGAVNITQSVTIDGSNLGSIINTNTSGTAVNINASSAVNVILRNLTIDGVGQGMTGVYFGGAGYLTIDNCRIENITNTAVAIGNEGAQNVVLRNTVILNSTYSFFVWIGTGQVQTSLQNVTIQGATQAAVYARSGVTEITNSVLTENLIDVETDTSSTISVESSMLTLNYIAVCSYPGTKIRLENDDIFDNGIGVANCGGQVKTNGNNRSSGNTNGNLISASDVSSTALF